MFEDFSRLQHALAEGTLADEWEALSSERMFVRGDAMTRPGHFAVRDFWMLEDALGEVMAQSGIYVFGSWGGDDARHQYVGIAHGYSLADRFRGRYVGSPAADARPWTEFRFAEAHCHRLLGVPNHFSPRRRIDAKVFTSRGVPLPASRGLWRRVVRAERYAKNGVGNTWFYPIPAPAGTTKKELETLERQLIMATNAYLYARHGRTSGAPLLNVVHARSRSNPYVPGHQLVGYNDWIDGSWWTSSWPAPA